MLQGIFNGRTHQTLCTFYRNRLDTERRGLGEAHLLHSHLIPQKRVKLLCFRRSLFPFDSGINVFCILTEDVHVDLLRIFQRRNHSLEPAYRTQTDIQVECLAQSHIQRTDSPAYRSRQRSLDTYQVFAESLHRSFRKPFSRLLVSFLSCQDLHPLNGTLAFISQFHSLVHNLLTSRCQFRTDPVAFNKWNSNT